MIFYSKIKLVTLLLFFSLILGCEKPNEEPLEVDCTLVEVNISCERPDILSINNLYSLLESHTPRGFTIMNTYLDGCFGDEDKTSTINSYITTYGDIAKSTDTISSLNTIIHELTHAIATRYTSESASFCERNEDKIWISKHTEIPVATKRLFPAKEIINSLIPIVANYFYTDEYIMGSSSTQTYGAYSLLNEYNAFYHGLSTTFELYPAVQEIYLATNDDEVLNNFIIEFENEITAYYSFKYYTLLYVHYAKQNHIEDYNNLSNNTNFWLAFEAVNENFENLLLDYKALIQNDAHLSSRSDFEILYDSQFRLIEEEIERIK